MRATDQEASAGPPSGAGTTGKPGDSIDADHDRDRTIDARDVAGLQPPVGPWTPTGVDHVPDRGTPHAPDRGTPHAPDRGTPHSPDGAAPLSGEAWSPDSTPTPGRVRPRRSSGASRLARAGATSAVVLIGALPVLWVLGAVPWRLPSLLIENMFRGFVGCALDGGALHPVQMVCPRAGVPVGMYQLDAGLTYPLGGLLVRWGVEPVTAWKIAVALLVVAGVAALYWLLRRLTGSAVAAAGFVALYGLNGTLTARTWNWYWNTVAAALLPVLFAIVYVVLARAEHRRLRPLAGPGLAAVATAVAIGIEWQYAGVFAAAVLGGATVVLLCLRGWRPPQRLAIAAAAAGALGLVAGVLQLRLRGAGVVEQFGDGTWTAAFNAVDLVSFVVPDERVSVLGTLLSGTSLRDLLARQLTSGSQLWVAPYLGVLTLVFLAAVAVARRRHRRHAHRRRPHRPDAEPRSLAPAGFLPLLGLIVGATVVLSTGPVLRTAWGVAPTTWWPSPLLGLWTAPPLQWIRYPWTWGYVTHVALLLAVATALPMVFRRGRSWSPLVWALAVLLALEWVSPATIAAVASDRPSVATAPAWARVTHADAAVRRFQSRSEPELLDALRSTGGPVVMLPWTNAWAVPRLGPSTGLTVRNTGIDRNVARAEAAAPFTRYELRAPTPEVVRRMLDSRWARAVVLLDVVPTSGAAVTKRAADAPTPETARWWAWSRETADALERAGYCVERGSWFRVVRRCDRGG